MECYPKIQLIKAIVITLPTRDFCHNCEKMGFLIDEINPTEEFSIVSPHGFLISALEMVYRKKIVVYRKKPACLENVSSRETAKEWEKNYCNF